MSVRWSPVVPCGWWGAAGVGGHERLLVPGSCLGTCVGPATLTSGGPEQGPEPARGSLLASSSSSWAVSF